MELGIGFGTAIVLYLVTKWAVRNGICEAYERITGQEVCEAYVQSTDQEAPDCGEISQGEISQTPAKPGR